MNKHWIKFGYTIIYVADVLAAVKFYSDAFGIAIRYVYEGGDYAELDTGETTLAFAAHALGEANLPDGYTKLADLEKPAGAGIAFVTDDVTKAVANATLAGATVVSDAKKKPWGQTVAYLRAPAGCLIELCTPVGGYSVF